MITEILGYTSVGIVCYAYHPYIKDILAGKTKPERISWLIWSVMGVIFIVTQYLEGATSSIWFTVAGTVFATLVFLLSLRHGEGGFHLRDKVILACVCAVLFIWYLSNDAALTIFLTVLIEIGAGYLTIIKTYRDPSTETLSFWLLSTLGAVLACLAVGELHYELLVFPVYIASFCMVMSGIIVFKPSIE